jgi:hypothetical protein
LLNLQDTIPAQQDSRPRGQEFYRLIVGLILAHFAVRGVMHAAALQADEDPDRLSFLHAVRVAATSPPSAPFPPEQRAAFHAAVLAESCKSASSPAETTAVPVGSSAK